MNPLVSVQTTACQRASFMHRTLFSLGMFSRLRNASVSSPLALCVLLNQLTGQLSFSDAWCACVRVCIQSFSIQHCITAVYFMSSSCTLQLKPSDKELQNVQNTSMKILLPIIRRCTPVRQHSIFGIIERATLIRNK